MKGIFVACTATMNYLSPTITRLRPFSRTASPHSGSSRPAFTLVEMLVVITIITVLLTIGALGLRNLGKSSGVSAGVPLAEAAFAEARALSAGNGGNSRLLIHADKNDREKYLRYMLVVYDSDPSPDAEKWVAASRGIYLPEGVYFSQEYSKEKHSDGPGSDGIESETHNVYLREDAGASNDNLTASYFYYKFNSEGISDNPGASFVCGTGTRAPTAEKPKSGRGSGAKNFGGFMVWAKGTTSVFRHPEQIGIPSGTEGGDEF